MTKKLIQILEDGLDAIESSIDKVTPTDVSSLQCLLDDRLAGIAITLHEDIFRVGSKLEAINETLRNIADRMGCDL